MDQTRLAIEVLKQAETSLRGIVAKAADAGDYEAVVQIASWASTISEMCGRAGGRKRISEVKPIVAAATAERKSPRAKSQTEYPKFFRQGDQLIRVAWSKKEKNEYQHKANYAVLQAVANAIAEVGSDGRVFSTQDFLPFQHPDDGPVPSYHVYVCLTLFKQYGLIDQHGRQGYSLTHAASFKEAVESAWKKLPLK